MRAALRRQAGIALAVWSIAFSLLAVVAALPSGPNAALTVDDATPYVDQPVRFDASGSVGHDAGNGRIVAYAFTFGDGHATGWLDSPAASHTYATEGNFTSTVTVKDGRGLTGQAWAIVSVRSRPSPGTSPDLAPVDAGVDPARPEVGENVSVTVLVMNLGGATATNASIRVLDIHPNGTSVEVGRTWLPQPLAPLGTEAVPAGTFVAADEGNHTLRILVEDVSPPEAVLANDEFLLPMTVLPPGSRGPNGSTPFSVDPLALGLVGLAVVSVIAAAVFLLRPRPPGPLEPPPASPPDQSPPPIWPP